MIKCEGICFEFILCFLCFSEKVNFIIEDEEKLKEFVKLEEKFKEWLILKIMFCLFFGVGIEVVFKKCKLNFDKKRNVW